MVGVFLLAYISVNLFLQSQAQKIQQAKIFSEGTEVPEGGKLEVTCSTFGFTVKPVYLYLCKDGKAIDMKNRPTRQDITFKIERIKLDNSGNYSCVFSEEQLEITEVMGYGQNNIFINVIESLINTQIHLLKSEVAVGSDAEFNCTTSNPINKNLFKTMILAFLIKNEKPIKVNILDTEEMMTTFTLREVQMEDAGTYSCAILLNVLPYHGMRLDRNNKVNLQITAQKIQQAKIFSEGTEVPEGGKLEVTCSTFGFTVKPVYLYLCKDGKAIDMKNRPTQQDITFKIERIEMHHSGNYSCVFSEEQLEITEVMEYGHNNIFINVIVHSSFVKVIFVIMGSSIVLLLSLFLGIWAVIRKRGFLGFHKERSLNETELRGNVFCEEMPKPDTAGTGEIQSIVCSASVWEEFSDDEDEGEGEDKNEVYEDVQQS